MVVYDGHIFRWQKHGGISRYFTEIISRLPSDFDPVIIGADADSELPPRSGLRSSARARIRPRFLTQSLKTAWWRRYTLRGASLFHPTYYELSSGLSWASIRCPVVITAHDFISGIYAHLESDAERTVAAQKSAIARADHIICVSKATERDLLQRFPEKTGRTSVVYHGSSFSAANGHVPQLEAPTFLFVGRRTTYKNFLFLARAFAAACRLHATIRLHVAGPALTEDERWHLHFLGVLDRVDVTPNPDERTLQTLYEGSAALLYPSRHEGFGIPPLEAMACGTVAVTSNTTSLPEVIGDAGIMLDPTDERAWAECMVALVTGKINREELIRRGRARAARFTWDASAQEHARIYREILAGGSHT